MAYAITGFPTTSQNEIKFDGVTSYHRRLNDCYLLGTTLSPTDHTSSSIYNKIFTNEFWLHAGMTAGQSDGIPRASDRLIFGILENKNNPLGISSAAAKGYTLFIKYGDEGSAAANEVPFDNIREKSTAWTAYIGVTANGFTFTMNRYFAFAMGFKDFGINPNGLTGCYTYYLINAEPQNYGELIWRVAFSFGGTSGKVYDGPPLWYDGFSAWAEIVRPSGPSYWLNNDGCMQHGMSAGDGSRNTSWNPDTPVIPSQGITDPRPAPVDYVQ